jgi:hypothetical protein
MGNVAWAAVLVAVALGGVASVALIAKSGEMFLPSSTSATPTASVRVLSPANGLELSLSLNSSSISTGQGIAATVRETNLLSRSDNVPVAEYWPECILDECMVTSVSAGELALGPCGPVNFPVGMVVLQGNYGPLNVSQAEALEIYQPGTSCPAVLSGQASVTGFDFQPSSDNATLIGTCHAVAGCLREIINPMVSFSGYWSGGAFTSLPNGVYTVVAGDEWGDVAMVHFTVTGNAA